MGGAAAVCGELRAEVTVASPGNTLLVQLTTGQSLEAVLFYSNKTQFISTLLHLVSLLKLPPLSPLELETKDIRRFAIRHYANQPARPLGLLCRLPNFTSTYRGVNARLA